MRCKINLKFLHDFDLFGKEPGLYYKGKEKRNTYFGSIISIIYLIIYLIVFVYKLIRLLKRKDITFYDAIEYLETPPSIKLSRDIFYGGFAVEDPITYDPFIDETIYYPKAYFKKGIRNGDRWNFDIKEIELERCKIDKFGKAFQDKIIHNSINNLYCFKDMNETLEGHFSYNMYSFFYIEFFPCINNTDNNNHCKPREEIDFYLNNSFVCFEMEDIELTPKNYSYPIRPRNQDIYFTIGKKLFQEVHIFYQLVNIETDLDILGFEELKNIKIQSFLKYFSQIQMTNLIENNIYDTGKAFSSVTIKLYDEIKIQRRTYTKIIEILGEVGGLMEFLFLIFKIISSFSTDILYQESVVNNLFEFDISKKLILLSKKKEKKRNNDITLKLQFPLKAEYKLTDNSLLNIENNNSKIPNKLNMNINKNKNNDIHKLNNFLLLKKPKSFIEKSSFINIINEYKYNNILFNKNMSSKNISRLIPNENKKKEIDKSLIINKISVSRFYIYFLFCFIKKRNNLHNILLNEGIKIFIEKMDILKIFKKMEIYDVYNIKSLIKNEHLKIY